jgi:hypothetical protein
MINPEYLKVLRIIESRLQNSNCNWVVTGSLGIALQGVPVAAHDIDIKTDKVGAYGIEGLFSEFVTKKVAFSTAERIRSHWGGLVIKGIQVDIIGDVQMRLENGTWEGPVDLESYKQFVEFAGMEVPVLSLAYEYQAYLKLGRLDKAELLGKWVSSQLSRGHV